MNKKGFTLIEVIVAVTIMLALLLIVLPNIRSIFNKNSTKLWTESENRLVEASNKYLVIKDIEVPIDDTITITKEQLIQEKLIKEVYDLNNKSNICNAYVIVNNVDGKYQSKAYIECPNGYSTQ